MDLRFLGDAGRFVMRRYHVGKDVAKVVVAYNLALLQREEERLAEGQGCEAVRAGSPGNSCKARVSVSLATSSSESSAPLSARGCCPGWVSVLALELSTRLYPPPLALWSYCSSLELSEEVAAGNAIMGSRISRGQRAWILDKERCAERGVERLFGVGLVGILEPVGYVLEA